MKKILILLSTMFLILNCSSSKSPFDKSLPELKREYYINNQLVDNYINSKGFKKEMAEQALVSKFIKDKEMLRDVPVNYFILSSTIEDPVAIRGMTFYNKQLPQLLFLKIYAPRGNIFENIKFTYDDGKKEYEINNLSKYYDFGYDQYLVFFNYEQMQKFYEMLKTRKPIKYTIKINTTDERLVKIYKNEWDHEEVMANLGLVEMAMNNVKDNFDFLDVLNNKK